MTAAPRLPTDRAPTVEELRHAMEPDDDAITTPRLRLVTPLPGMRARWIEPAPPVRRNRRLRLVGIACLVGGVLAAVVLL